MTTKKVTEAYGGTENAPRTGRVGRILAGPLHGSKFGRGFGWVVERTDGVLRHLSGVTEFEEDGNGLLRIELRRTSEETVLSDETRIHAGDTMIELHIWNEHFPPFPERRSVRWVAEIQQQMRSSLTRLAQHVQHNPSFDAVRALRMRPPLSDRRPANALARLLLSSGFEQTRPVPVHGAVLRFLDNFWAWLLTWEYNPRALVGWQFSRTRHEFWISRSRFLMLYGDRGTRDEADEWSAAEQPEA